MIQKYFSGIKRMKEPNLKGDRSTYTQRCLTIIKVDTYMWAKFIENVSKYRRQPKRILHRIDQLEACMYCMQTEAMLNNFQSMYFGLIIIRRSRNISNDACQDDLPFPLVNSIVSKYNSLDYWKICWHLDVIISAIKIIVISWGNCRP